MILRLTRTTAQLLGESTTEWQAFEKQVRLELWTSGARTDEGRLRQLATELGVPLRVEGMPVLRSKVSNADCTDADNSTSWQDFHEVRHRVMRRR